MVSEAVPPVEMARIQVVAASDRLDDTDGGSRDFSAKNVLVAPIDPYWITRFGEGYTVFRIRFPGSQLFFPEAGKTSPHD